MTDPETFDAVVIGTGQGGRPLATDLAEAGHRTAIVERDRVGGTCVVRGCTPTKTMWASARVTHLARRAADYGVDTGEVAVDMAAVRRRKRAIVDDWVAGSRKGLEETEGLELIFGDARFTGPRELEIALRDGTTRRLGAERVFLNTGARPVVPPIEGLEGTEFLDNTSVMELGEVPEHLVVLGGGYVGLEFAQMFRRFGAEVTVIDLADRLAVREDPDVSEALREIFEEDGLRVLLETEARAVASSDDGGVILRLEGPEGEEELGGSHLLVAVGRRPNSDGLGLEVAGVDTDDRGHVVVNGRLETSADGVWALGDVTGRPPFTHTSYDDYRIVRDNLLHGAGRTDEDRILTYTVFTDPQLGRVGATEQEAREAGHDVRVAKLPMSSAARAIEMDETRGFMKAVVDGDTDRILGASILGVEGGETAMALKIAMMGDLPYTALREAVLAHPTLAESLNNLFMTLDE